jgi:hypothetical protein
MVKSTRNESEDDDDDDVEEPPKSGKKEVLLETISEIREIRVKSAAGNK